METAPPASYKEKNNIYRYIHTFCTFGGKLKTHMPKLFKLFIILSAGILSFISASAQKSNSFVGIRFGFVLPMGEFGSQEYGEGGYALLGRSFGGEAAWFVTPKLGFGVDVSSNSFGFASGFYVEDYKQSEPAFTSIGMLSGQYIVKTYMGGVYYKATIHSKFHSTFKLMGGLFNARTPNQLFYLDAFGGMKLTFWKTSAQSSKFGFLTGASFEYKLYKQVSLLLQADFTYTKAAFAFKTSTASGYTNYLQMPVFRLQPGINIHF